MSKDVFCVDTEHPAMMRQARVIENRALCWGAIVATGELQATLQLEWPGWADQD